MIYNYKMLIAYDGTRYNGWQKQGNTDNTIQGKLNEIIGRFTGEEVDVAGSGRTDKGVHAKGQVISFKLNSGLVDEKKLEPQYLMTELNKYLPKDIRIIESSKADERFHARLSAVKKLYTYHISNGDIYDVFSRDFEYHIEEKLDVEAMRAAADYLVGSHDFKSFCGNKHFKKSSEREIYSINLEQIYEEQLNGSRIIISYEGNGFLQNMVRIMTGTLIEVGLGNILPDYVKSIIAAKDREKAGPMAPAQGLFLEKVMY